jgi:cytochrome d ubiquinol oxidase subunit II
MGTLWFCLATMAITGYVLLDGVDLGAGIVQLFVARAERETSQVLNSIGPVWDGNEVWLLVAGGTPFFAFPALYAFAFSGFYLSLMIVLWLLILRGISIESGLTLIARYGSPVGVRYLPWRVRCWRSSSVSR